MRQRKISARDWQTRIEAMVATMPALPSHPVSSSGDGRRYWNPRHHGDRTWRHLLRWKLARTGQPWPRSVDIAPADLPPAPADGTLTATWINHATCLLQTRFGTLLTDPIYSERASPISWIGPRRVHVPGVAWNRLPPIDVVLLSHNYYDHCDQPTRRRLSKQDPSCPSPSPRPAMVGSCAAPVFPPSG